MGMSDSTSVNVMELMGMMGVCDVSDEERDRKKPRRGGEYRLLSVTAASRTCAIVLQRTLL